MKGWSESEMTSYQTPIFNYVDFLPCWNLCWEYKKWFKLKYPCDLMEKLYLQGMLWWNESERTSCQTQVSKVSPWSCGDLW